MKVLLYVQVLGRFLLVYTPWLGIESECARTLALACPGALAPCMQSPLFLTEGGTSCYLNAVSSVMVTGPMSPEGISSDLLSKKWSCPR